MKITLMDYITGQWYPKILLAFRNASPEQKRKALRAVWGKK